MNLARTILIVAPHPDDEILGCGGLMRRAQAAGGRIVVAWLTDGGGSHGKIDVAARERLVATRQDEARAGLAALGVSAQTYFLGFPDGDLAAHEGPAREALRAICADAQVHTVFVTRATDSHPDHRASSRIVAGLPHLALYEYPVSARYDGEPVDVGDAIVIDEPAAMAAKRAALACHASQTAAGGARYPLSAAAIERFCSAPELFVAIGQRA